MTAAPIEARERGWSFAEATILRATAFIHLATLAFGLLAPKALFGAWGLPFQEPATFLRFAVVAIGALGLALLRAVRLPRAEGRLLVETVALIKLALVAVIVADTFAGRLPPQAPIAATLDFVLGIALFRAARRR